MGQLTITLPDDLENEVREQVYNGNYGSVSDYVRDALRTSSASKEPTYWRRVELYLQLDNNRLLRKLADEDFGHEWLLEGIQSGYPSTYSHMDEIVSDNPLSLEQTQFVYDVLAMYERMQISVKDVDDKKLQEDVEFDGFDGNNEPRLLGFVHFLVRQQSYAHVRPLDKIPNYKSHMPMIDVYQRMLEVYNPIKVRKPFGTYKFTLDEVKQILAGRIHPDHRK